MSYPDSTATPLWTAAQNNDDLIASLQTELSELQQVHAWDSWRHAANGYAYDRERYYALAGVVPGWASGYFPWLRSNGDSRTPYGPNNVDEQKGKAAPSTNIVRIAADTVLNQLLANVPALRVGIEGGGLETLFVSRDRSSALSALLNASAQQQTIRQCAIEVVLSGVGFLKQQIRNDALELVHRPRSQVLWDYNRCHDRALDEQHEWYTGSKRSVLAQLAASDAPQEVIDQVDQLKESYERNPPWTSDGVVPWRPDQWYIKNQRISTQLFISEHYQTATADTADDGRHVVAVWGVQGGVIIYDESYCRTKTPLIKWNYTAPRHAQQSAGIADIVMPWQRKIDTGSSTAVEALEVVGKTLVFGPEEMIKAMVAPGINPVPVPRNALPNQQLQVVAPTPVNPQVLEWVEKMPDEALRNAGVSQFLEASVSQLGANAPAIALQAEESRTRNRLGNVTQERTAAMIALGSATLYALDALVRQQPKARARWDVYGDYRTLPWKQLLPPRGDREVRIEPYGATANSFAAQLAIVQDYSDRGVIGPLAQKLGMLDDPDMRRLAQYELAPIKLVMRQIEDLVRSDGNDIAKAERWGGAMPDANTPFEIAQELVTKTIQLALARRENDETITRLATYLAELEQFAPAPAPVADPAMMQPPTPDLAAGVF